MMSSVLETNCNGYTEDVKIAFMRLCMRVKSLDIKCLR